MYMKGIQNYFGKRKINLIPILSFQDFFLAYQAKSWYQYIEWKIKL